ncbi:MAG: MerR family transcriptional regulator [Eubacteriales bacterium]|nr:MerR family transcriptional regulator [Eubacteriales bacterium]
MPIAAASKKYDISAATLRYYERIGLLPPVPRNKSGIRNYDEESCGWIELMKCMRAAGVQIEALIEYVALFRRGDETLDASKAILIEQRAQLAARMADMQRSLDRLDYKISMYEQGLMRVEKRLQKQQEARETACGA